MGSYATSTEFQNTKKDDEDSIQKQDSLDRMKDFLVLSRNEDILLEALIASALLHNSDLADIFDSGMAKAAHFSEHGDIQTVIHVVSRWALCLHTKPKLSLTTWCQRNGIKEKKLKEIDQCLLKIHHDLKNWSKIDTNLNLKFNKDITFVYETMTDKMVKLWYDHLCIYRGHTDLGYLHIASKTIIQVGKKSVFKLRSIPSIFALCFNNTNESFEKTEASNLWISVSDKMAESVLSRYYKTTVSEMLNQFNLVPVIITDVGFELGSQALSTNLAEKIKFTCDDSAEIFYNKHHKTLTVMCRSVNASKVTSVVNEELERLKKELAKQIIEIPYPNSDSPIRLLIGEGLKCCGLTGFRWNFHRNISDVHYQFYVDTSISLETDHFALRTLDSCQCQSTNCEEKVSDHRHISEWFVLTKDTKSIWDITPVALKHLKDNEVIMFDGSVAVTVSCDTKNKWGAEDFASQTKDESNAISSLKQSLTEIGLKLIGQQGCCIAGQSVKDENEIMLEIVFPDLTTANAGISGISKSNTFCLKDQEKIQEDLKTFRILFKEDLFHRLESSLFTCLGHLQRNNSIQSHKKVHLPVHKEVHLYVTVSNRYQVPSIQEALKNSIQPVKTTVTNDNIRYLRGCEGQQFVHFLMDLTNTYIHIPEYQNTILFYGETSRKLKSKSILISQLEETFELVPIIKWRMLDLSDAFQSTATARNWYKKIYSHINELKCIRLISKYFLCENRPELWIESSLEVFDMFVEEIEFNSKVDSTSRVEIVVECSICFYLMSNRSKECCLLSVCGHAYCKSCLEKLVNVSVRNHQVPIQCAHLGCDKKLSAHENFIHGLLVLPYSNKLLKLLLNEFAAECVPSIRTCGDSRCGGVGFLYEAEGMESCFWCHRRFCSRCKCRFHGDVKHGDFNCEKYSDAMEWIAELPSQRKQCANCKIPIQKSEGCDCVYCSWCKVYFCWICTSFIDKNSGKVHKHMDECHPV